MTISRESLACYIAELNQLMQNDATPRCVAHFVVYCDYSETLLRMIEARAEPGTFAEKVLLELDHMYLEVSHE
jgi:hypothetical protein